MNSNSYLKFLETLISSKQIKEKTSLGCFYNNLEIENKLKNKKNIKEEFITISIELENKKLLLIEDLPINFLLSHSILIGNQTQLIEIEHIESKKIYILDESLLESYQKYFNKNSIKKIKIEEIFKKKFTLSFKQPIILQELKKYILETKKINLESIHIVKGKNVENFLPTIKARHFKLAKKMALPLLRPMITNNFIKESNINIKDNNNLKKQFQILFLREKILSWDFHKNTNARLYKDISRQYVICPNIEILIEKIEKISSSYPSKDKIINLIKNSNEIIISQNEGNTPLPIWKSHRNQDFIPIKDTNEFLNLTGSNFKLDAKIFEKLFIQSLNGDAGIYSKLYLKTELEKYIDINYENNLLLFNTSEDLIIKLIQYKNLSVIIQNDKLSITQEFQFKKKLKFLIKKLILKSINKNKIFITYDENNFLNKFYLNSTLANARILEKYSNYPSQKNLLKESLENLNQVYLCVKILGFSNSEQYCLSNYIFNTIKLYFYLFPEISKKFEEIFLLYFKHFNEIPISEIKKETQILKLISDLIQLKKIAKKEKIYISKVEKIAQFLPEDIQFLNPKLKYEEYLVPNSKKIKKTFSYMYSDVIKAIKKLKPKEINKKILIKKKEILLKEDYYSIYKKYKDYSLIEKNDFYSLYRLKKKYI